MGGGNTNCASCKVWTTTDGDSAQRVCAACQKKLSALKAKTGAKSSSS